MTDLEQRGMEGASKREAGSSTSGESPWGDPVVELVLVTPWTVGPDPGVDPLVRVQAVRLHAGGQEELDRWCRPGPGETGRALDGLGALVLPEQEADAGAAFESGDTAEEVWEELLDLVGGRPVLCPDATEFRALHAVLAGDRGMPPLIGLDEVARLLQPGRRTAGRGPLVARLCGTDAPAPPRGVAPSHLRAALSELARGFLSLPADGLHALCGTLAAAWSRLHATEPVGAAGLGLVLRLLEGLDAWFDSRPGDPAPAAPRFQAGDLDAELLSVVLDEVQPRWSVERRAWEGTQPLPPFEERGLPFDPEDRRRLDAVFETHLPALLGEERGQAGPLPYREGQHEVARAVARNFGHSGEAETQLLLVHAPTGTGKTLAYLLPALLWARRHGVRVGLATYTRALQEQAFDREVPRAQELLRRAGAEEPARVALLKGRENYLCWRTLRLHLPSPDADGEAWLAFAQVLAFALTDEAGDLDRLPRRSPLTLGHTETYRSALDELVRQTRARNSCCRDRRDRRACGADVARWRAERSHVVVTNHSFVLARQEFFRHLVFDECEHLHDQAHAAWSHAVGVSQIDAWLDRLYEPGRSRQRTLFTRVARRIVEGTPSWETLSECRALHEELSKIHKDLSREVHAFDTWRNERSRERGDSQDHSLLREFVEGDHGSRLIARRVAFQRKGSELDERLAQLGERLEKSGGSRLGRLRRALEQARADLDEILSALCAWLPLEEGRPRFAARTFHDVEVGQRGELQLAARVLLPNEFLGRHYYPQLRTASFLSATTWLKDGFEAATSYLGLDRAVESVEDDPDLLCTLRTFRAPEVFDYSRVLVAVPRDAPSVRDRDAFLEYARSFIADLGERTGGRILALFTNADDVRRVGTRLEGHFRARSIGFWYQNMPGVTKEEISELFRERVDSVLLGVDTFWYGADFPGETLEHLVIVRLPYGVPDRYHHAQCAALGVSEQRRQIYMPRALAKFRQGFGRLMRRTEDRGCVYLLDHRVLEPRHRAFLRELPVGQVGQEGEGLARLVRGDTGRCLEQAMIHIGLEQGCVPEELESEPGREVNRITPPHERTEAAEPADVDLEDLPF
jgi:Rad3-related DNA helicase